MSNTINFTGTGGIIEGNLGTADVDVNLDPVYGNFNGSTSSINAGSPTMFDDIFNGAGSITAWIFPKSVGQTAGRIFDKAKWALTMSDGANVLEFDHQFSTTNGLWKTGAVVPFNVWTHVAVVYDGSSDSNDPVIYINGVATAIAHKTAPDGTRTSDSGDNLFIGNRADVARTFDGYIMDAKIYKASGLSSTQIPIAAAKINQDPDLISPNPPKGWYKFNASTTADSSGNSNTAVNVGDNMGSVVYDAFSVDVYDGYDGSDATTRTQTDGAFEISQGKVECKALSSVSFDGTDDVVKSSGSTDIMNDKDATLSFWFKGASHSGGNTILESNNNYNEALIYTRNGNEMRLYSTTGATNEFGLDSTQVTASGLYDGNWHHMVWVLDHGGQSHVIYVDGVSYPVTFLTANNHTVDWNGISIGGEYSDLTGSMKDVRFYDYHLSADQAASLYSGSYNVTPLWGWKLDESDSYGGNAKGFGTAQSGGAVDLTVSNATWVDGTLDLDGTLTIAPEGTLSAPRGDLELHNHFTDNGTFTHNSGEVKMTSSGRDLTGSASTVFYDLTTEGYNLILKSAFTVENLLLSSGSNSWKFNENTTVTMGTATSQGTIQTGTAGSKGLRFTTGSKTIKFAAADTSGLNPWIGIDGGSQWNIQAANVKVQLENCDMRFDFHTDPQAAGNNGEYELTGDCEFHAFTVGSGDELDLGGKRAVFGGTLTNNGNIDYDGLVFLDGGINDDGSATNTASCKMIFSTNTGTTDTSGSGVGLMMINHPSFATSFTGGRMGTTTIIGSGEYRLAGGTSTVTDLTIATGGELDDRDSGGTVTCSGDFTTSGGLLGASCLTLNGSDEYAVTAETAWGFEDAWTIEFWFKTSTDALMYLVDMHNGSDNNNRIYLRLRDDSTLKFGTYDSGGTEHGLHVTGIDGDDGKWHHVAITSSGTVKQCYYDGKLQAQSTTTVNRSTENMVLLLGELNTGGSHWNGSIDEFRIWDAVRTPAQIRSDMFKSGYGNLTSAGNLMAAYNFDEGTDSTAACLEDASPTTARNLRLYNGSGLEAVDLWAEAGGYDGDASELVMTGTDAKINYLADDEYGKLSITGTVSLNGVDSTSAALLLRGNLNFTGSASGTLASTSSEHIVLDQTWKNNGRVIGFHGSGNHIANLSKLRTTHTSGTIEIPACAVQRIYCEGSGTTKATGDLTIQYHLLVASGNTFNANGFTMTGRTIDVNGGTINLVNSTWDFTREANYGIDLTDGSTLITGNTTLNGHPTHSNKTVAYLPAIGGFELVGDISDFKIKSGGDLTVIGAVIDCELEDSTANIRQWHHTLDTQQLLDADEAGDDDLRLTKPALDNALELMTK